MPTSETPTSVNEPEKPAETAPETAGPAQESPAPVRPQAEPAAPIVLNSRWIDYDTHELLSMISELEDERRWARLREGALWAVLVHLALIVGLAMLPKYIFLPKVVEPRVSDLHNKDQWTYLHTPRLPARAPAPKPTLNPPKAPVIDQKTLEEMRKMSPPAPEPPPPTPAEQAKPQVTSPIPPAPQSQSQVEVPRPSAVPARPNFALGSQNPADQLRDAMRGASQNNGAGNGGLPYGGGLARHPGAGGGVEVLSDTQGVDFRAWLQRWHHETQNTWDPLIPDEVNPPILKSGQVVIRFKVLPNGRLMEGSMQLEGRSGDSALDRAAWGALTGSNYPPLPRDFHGPYLELRAIFMYNMEPR
jgi:hypothetical protein